MILGAIPRPWDLARGGLLLALIVALSPSYSLAILIVLYALAVLGSTVLLRSSGLLTLGQGIFFGLGAYTVGIGVGKFGLSYPLSLLIGGVATLIVGYAVGYISTARRDVYFVMLTFGFAMLFTHLVYVFPAFTGGENGISGVRPPILWTGASEYAIRPGLTMYIGLSLVYLVSIVAVGILNASFVGLKQLATKHNYERSEAVGIAVHRLRTWLFVSCAMLAFVGGAGYAVYIGGTPSTVLEFDVSVSILIMTILGGVRSLNGPLIGAAVYLVAADVLSLWWDRWGLLLASILIVVVYIQKDLEVRSDEDSQWGRAYAWLRSWGSRSASTDGTSS